MTNQIPFIRVVFKTLYKGIYILNFATKPCDNWKISACVYIEYKRENYKNNT